MMRAMKKTAGWLPAALAALQWAAVCPAGAAAPVTLNAAEFRDKVYACWLGKNIGGTLGMPFEGKRESQNITFFTKLKPGEPAANDDLDLQLLWLKAMQEHGAAVDARILGEYWLKYVPVNWNEYGVGKKNMRRGLLPPLSGEFDNAQWKHSNGAWIRSEIWACLAPGCPGQAARFAREDACVDHGAAEGTLAEIFTAAIESAAFVESDRVTLLTIGLAMIPSDCGVARAVRAALAARQAGKDWQQARADVIAATQDTGWFQAPRNVAFTMIGWLYGDGDFGRSICTAVNCGDDTDCTGATLGSLWGILHGTRGIPQKWTEPVGTGIKNVAIAGFAAPKDLATLTDQTVAMTRQVQAKYNLPVVLSDRPTDLRRVGKLTLADTTTAKALWALSPFQVVWNESDLQVTLDYLTAPHIKAGEPRRVEVTVRNRGGRTAEYMVALAGVPAGWKVTGLPAAPVRLKSGAARTLPIMLTADVVSGETHLQVEVAGGAQPVRVPLTLLP